MTACLLVLQAPAAGAGILTGWEQLGEAAGLTDVRAVAIDPVNPSLIYAGTATGLFKSQDSGTSWSALKNGLTGLGVNALALNPTSPLTLLAGVFSIPGDIDEGGAIYRTTDGGSSWISVLQLSSVAIYGLEIDRGNPSRAYAATSAGLYRSTDAGATWTASNVGPGATYAWAVAADPVSSAVYAAYDFGVLKSIDAGLNWTVAGGPLELTRDVHVVSGVVYAAAVQSGPAPISLPRQAFIYRSTDGGTTWTDVSGGAFGHFYDVSRIAIDPTNASHLYAGTFNSGVYRTVDEGTHWTPVSAVLAAPLEIRALTFDPLSPNVVYAAAYEGLFRQVFQCAPDAASLCLNSNRFRVQASWRAESLGTSGTGQPMPLTTDTGAFWFFNPSNIELVIKVLDGRAINGKFWVFYGALSNVEYTITVTDTVSGDSRTYNNPQGQLASVADTSAF